MRNSKRIISILSILILMILSVAPISVSATSKGKLNKTEITIVVGKQRKLKVLNDTRKVTWYSSNKRVARVSNDGVVTARKRGVSKITAKVGKKKYSCTVKVKERPELVKKTAICVGQERHLSVTGTSKKPSWKSSDKQIVKVNRNGVVKGLKQGSAKITAKVGRKKLTCKVKVGAAINPVTINLEVDNSGFMQVNYLADEIYAKVSDSSIAKAVIGETNYDSDVNCYVADVIVYGIKSGTVNVTLTNSNNDEKVTFKAIVNKTEVATGEQKMIDYLIGNGKVTENGCLLAEKSYKQEGTQVSEVSGGIEYDPLEKDVNFSCVVIIEKTVVEWNLMSTQNGNTEYYITMWINAVKNGKTSENFVTAKIDSGTFTGDEIVYEDGWYGTSADESLQIIANTATDSAITLLGEILKGDMSLSWSEIGFVKLG